MNLAEPWEPHWEHVEHCETTVLPQLAEPIKCTLVLKQTDAALKGHESNGEKEMAKSVRSACVRAAPPAGGRARRGLTELGQAICSQWGSDVDTRDQATLIANDPRR